MALVYRHSCLAFLCTPDKCKSSSLQNTQPRLAGHHTSCSTRISFTANATL